MESLRALRPDLPVVLCTGFSSIMTPESAAAMGIRAYLTKPVGIRELASAMAIALEPQPAEATT